MRSLSAPRVLALAAVLISAFAQAPPAQTRCAGRHHMVPPVRPFRLPPRIGVFGEAQISLATSAGHGAGQQ